MATIKGGQGQSAVTLDKERRIAAAISIGMRIASSRFGGKGFKFWHFDANSGCGWNDAVDVPGSPLVFWQAAKECLSGLEPCPFFCDFDKTAMEGLHGRISQNEVSKTGSNLILGDNEEGIEIFSEYIRRSRENPAYAVGSIIVDPNGYFYRNAKNVGAPVNALPALSREFPRIDIILNLNIRTFHLQRSQNHNVIPPRDVLRSLNKKQWLVGRAGSSGCRFLLAIGRNIVTGDHKSLGLHDAESEIGQSILNAAESQRQESFDL